MTENERLADRECRALASSDLEKSYVVEAAAGTGKTTVLVDRILRAVCTTETPLDRIVAITFTERAAAELKVRIRSGLERALGDATSDAKRKRLTGALAGLERMQVATIHSFCAALLRERPVEAGVDPNFQVADELTASLLRAEVLERWLGKHLDQADDKADSALRQALRFGLTTKHISELAQKMRANRDVLGSPKPIEPIEETVERFVAEFRESVSRLREFLAECRDAKDGAATLIVNLVSQLQKLETLAGEERDLFVYREMHRPTSKKVGRKENWPGDAICRVRSEFEEIGESLERVQAAIADALLWRLVERLRDFVASYQAEKRRQDLLDFEDLLIVARDLLRDSPDVRSYFQRRYDMILVDEFQDTDPLQAEIVFFLTDGSKEAADKWRDVAVSPGRLFLVGDPKQSIYRFRRADIEMYAQAKSVLGEKQLLHLSKNFRCAPSIVGLVNKLFEDLIRPPDDGEYQPDYVPLELGRPTETIPPVHGTVLLYPPSDPALALHKADERREYESRCIAAFIRKTVERGEWQVWDDAKGKLRPIQLRDIAILIRTYTGLETIEYALRDYGVEYRVMGGKHFYRREEVQQLLAVLRAVDNPYDRVALVAALRSPFFGISDVDIFLFHADGGKLDYLGDLPEGRVGSALRFLRSLHEMRNDANVAAILRRLYEETSAVALYLLKPHGEQRVANLMRLGDVARALAESGVLSFRGCVSWLAELEEKAVDEGEPPTLEPGDNFVRVLTVHKAKGLEFPVVILADLAYSRGFDEPLIIERSSGSLAIKLGDKDNRVQTANYEKLSRSEAKRAEAEERRILYVAMTRARDFLVLPAYWSKQKNGEWNVPKGSFLSYLQPVIPQPGKATPATTADGFLIYDTDSLDLNPPETGASRIRLRPDTAGGNRADEILAERERWQNGRRTLLAARAGGRSILHPSEIVGDLEEAGPDVDHDEDVDRPMDLARPPHGGAGEAEGKVFGQLVHKLLEAADWERPDVLDSLAETEGKALGAPAATRREAAELVRTALASEFVKRILRSRRYQKEVPFSFANPPSGSSPGRERRGTGEVSARDAVPLADAAAAPSTGRDTLVEGVIDVLFEEDDGLVIVDFKTDLLTEDELPARAERYRPQLEIYARAVEAILGRPPKEKLLFFIHLMKPFPIR